MKFLLPWKKNKSRIHLDYASTTPVRKEVLSEMLPYFSEKWANASAIYKEGVVVRTKIEEVREELARTLRVRAQDVTFTSGGTESNNLAILGYIEALHVGGRAYTDMEILTTSIEHPSILETLRTLETKGIAVRYLPIDDSGLIDHGKFLTSLNDRVVLLTCAYVNSEVGVIQDVKKISHTLRKYNKDKSSKIVFHLDACQAPLWLPCALDALGVDLLSLDAGKCYGPKGMGVFVHRHWIPLTPISFGGGQEGGLRPGTENTPLIIGGARAIMRAQEGYEARSMCVTALRDRALAYINNELRIAVINGSASSRVANNINISLPGFDTEYAVIWLDARGIAVSTRSACGTGKLQGSHVVREITHDEARATSTLRITLGEETSFADIEKFVIHLKEFLAVMTQEGKL